MIIEKPRIVGILALQGSFAEHAAIVRKLGYEVRLVRSLNDTQGVRACILPGGESTTLMNLLKKTGLDDWLKEFAFQGLPAYGTCAGMIVLSKLGLIGIELERNAYGPQLFSFETTIDFRGESFPGIFIRAPKVSRVNDEVEILAKNGETPVLVKQGSILAGSFHPELTDDTSIHAFFLEGL